MRIRQMDTNTLVLVSHPWVTVLLLLVLTLGLVSLSISAFLDGETATGSIFLIASAVFAIALSGFSAFEQVRFDRRTGAVEISGRNVFRRWSKTMSLSDIEGAKVIAERGSGKRNRSTFVAALVLKDPQAPAVPLSIISGNQAPAERAATAISDWLAGTGPETLGRLRRATLLSFLSVIAVNLAAIIPVLAGHWSVWELITFYWVELLVVSLLFGCKMVILSVTCDTHTARTYVTGTGLIIGWTAIWVG